MNFEGIVWPANQGNCVCLHLAASCAPADSAAATALFSAHNCEPLRRHEVKTSDTAAAGSEAEHRKWWRTCTGSLFCAPDNCSSSGGWAQKPSDKSDKLESFNFLKKV